MRKILPTVMLLFAACACAWGQTAPGKDDRQEATAVVNKLFEAMRVKDAAAIRALFMPEGQLVAVDKPRTGSGLSKTRVFTAAAFAELIAGAKAAEFREVMPGPKVEIFGDMALVFGPYTFHVGEKFSHCGTNSFHLVRTADGWRIANGASTLEFDCGQKTVAQTPKPR